MLSRDTQEKNWTLSREIFTALLESKPQSQLQSVKRQKKVKSYHLGRNIPCSIILQTNSAIVWGQTSASCYRKVVCSYHYTISAMSPWSHL